MYTITDILKGDAKYRKYIYNKTSFLLNQNSVQKVKYSFLEHLIHMNDISQILKQLNTKEIDLLINLLSNFAYISSLQVSNLDMQTYQSLEKKVSFIFKLPNNEVGFFIPLELLRVLMKNNFLYKNNFILGLLNKLPKKQLIILFHVLQDKTPLLSLELQTTHKLDICISMYIWYYYYINKVYKKINVPNKLLLEKITSYSILKEPILLWNFLSDTYPDQNCEIKSLQYLYEHSDINFLKLFEILSNKTSIILDMIKLGLILPTFKNNNIYIITPKESFYFYHKIWLKKNQYSYYNNLTRVK